MAFGFKARVLLELGAELISSDAVALYELVKNSLDANASAVRIDMRMGMQRSASHLKVFPPASASLAPG